MNILIDRKGVAFFFALQMIIIAVLICAGLVIAAARDSYDITRLRHGAQAYFLSEAGVEEALRDLNIDFDYVPAGYPKRLGAGTYSVSITDHPTIADRRLVTASGTVGNVTKTVRLQVEGQSPAAFDYAVLSGGALTISGANVISDGSSVDVHSNNRDRIIGGTIDGRASACGSITAVSVDISGGTYPNSPYVEIPPFDDNFFQYYYDLAAAGGKVYDTPQTFTPTKNPCAGAANHVVYVNGTVTLSGSFSFTGCIVATGRITVAGVVIQSQYGNLPAYITKGAITIAGTNTVEGMVYSGGALTVSGTNTVTGSLCSRSSTMISGTNTIHYDKPLPPGMPSSESGAVNVLSWSE
jgi:hypothetical protein